MSPREASPNLSLTLDPEIRAEFLLRLRSRGLRDLAVLRALEAVPREIFAPERFAHLAMRDIALPLACGQTMSEPFLVGTMAEALKLDATCRVLEIGSGSAFGTAILARLSGEVVSIERYRSLAVAGQRRLEALGIDNAEIFWGDGLAFAGQIGRFDRLIVHGRLDALPDELLERLASDAVAVFATTERRERPCSVVRAIRSGGIWAEAHRICSAALAPLTPGLAKML